MKMKYLVPAFLAFSLVSGAVLSTDASAWSHMGSKGDGYSNNGSGGGYHSGGMSGGGHRGMGGSGHMGSKGNCPYMGGQGSNLSDEDMKKHNAMIEENQDKIRPLREQLFVKGQELQALQNATNPDVAAVKKVANEIVDIEEKIVAQRKAFRDSMEKSFK